MSKLPSKVYIVVRRYEDGHDEASSKSTSNCFYIRKGDATHKANQINKYPSVKVVARVQEADLVWRDAE